MLLHKPMVVMYRVGAMTYKIAQRMMKTQVYSLPNILATQQLSTDTPDAQQEHDYLVPELIQDEATAEKIAQQVSELLQPEYAEVQIQQLKKTVQRLRQMSALSAAEAALTGFMYYKKTHSSSSRKASKGTPPTDTPPQ